MVLPCSEWDLVLLAELLSLPVERYPSLGLSSQRKKEKTFEALLRQLETLAAAGAAISIAGRRGGPLAAVAAELPRATREVTAAFLACGIDPKKHIIFNQSQVAEHAERHQEHQPQRSVEDSRLVAPLHQLLHRGAIDGRAVPVGIGQPALARCSATRSLAVQVG